MSGRGGPCCLTRVPRARYGDHVSIREEGAAARHVAVTLEGVRGVRGVTTLHVLYALGRDGGPRSYPRAPPAAWVTNGALPPAARLACTAAAGAEAGAGAGAPAVFALATWAREGGLAGALRTPLSAQVCGARVCVNEGAPLRGRAKPPLTRICVSVCAHSGSRERRRCPCSRAPLRRAAVRAGAARAAAAAAVSVLSCARVRAPRGVCAPVRARM